MAESTANKTSPLKRISHKEKNLKKIHIGWYVCYSTFCFNLILWHLLLYMPWVYFYNWVSYSFCTSLTILNAEIRNWDLLSPANVVHGPKSSRKWVLVLGYSEPQSRHDQVGRIWQEESCLVRKQFWKVPKRLLMTKTRVSFLFAS